MSFKILTEGTSLTFQSALFLATSITALAILAVHYAARPDLHPSIPLYHPGKSAAGSLKKRWMSDSVNLLQKAYKKVTISQQGTHLPFLLTTEQYHGNPFRVWTTEGTQIVIPPDYVDELKMLPDHTLPSALRNV